MMCVHSPGECALCNIRGPVENKVYRCKHCKVEVISRENTQPILGRSHGKHCPRRYKSAKPRFTK